MMDQVVFYIYFTCLSSGMNCKGMVFNSLYGNN
jgi:hypothetical protein